MQVSRMDHLQISSRRCGCAPVKMEEAQLAPLELFAYRNWSLPTLRSRSKGLRLHRSGPDPSADRASRDAHPSITSVHSHYEP
jgi:hypothetical protein